MKSIISFIESLIIFIIFGSIYFILEIIYDGTSHWSMFICAGLTGNVADYIQKNTYNMKLLNKSIIITSNILVLEYITGYIFNIYLNLNIWDYSANSYNLSGQICLLFALIWFFLFSPLIIWLVEAIRYTFFGEKKPQMFYYYYLHFLKDLWELPYKINIKIKKLNNVNKKKA